MFQKLDLLEDMEYIHYYQGIYQAIGYDFVLSIEELALFWTNQTTVFMGQTRKIDLAPIKSPGSGA